MIEHTHTTNDLNTPEWILELVRALGPIVLDPCHNPWSTVGALFTASLHDGEDGLSFSWLEVVQALGPGLVYVNPPYGYGPPVKEGLTHGPPLLPGWSSKIAEEAAAGCEIVSLTPLAPDTEWYRRLRGTCNARVDVDKRVSFPGGKHGTGQIRNEIFYHGPRRYLFAHVFEAVGELRVYDGRV